MKNVWIYQGILSDGPAVFSNPKIAFNFFKKRADFQGKRKIKYNREQGKQSIITYASYLRALKKHGVFSCEDIYDEMHVVIKREVNQLNF